MNIKKMIQKIVDDGDRREMEELSDILEKVTGIVYDYDEEKGKEIEMQIYKMAYGNVLNKKMAENIISEMKPYRMHWDLEQSKNIQMDYNSDDIRDIDFWVVINSAYNDYNDIFKDNLEMYVAYTRDFILDEDAKNSKVFLYFTSIPE